MDAPLDFAQGRLSPALSRVAPSRSPISEAQETRHLRGGLISVAPTALGELVPHICPPLADVQDPRSLDAISSGGVILSGAKNLDGAIRAYAVC